jgi:ankyrin repeat protein
MDIFQAIYTGDLKDVCALVDAGADVNLTTESERWPPLLQACCLGKTDIATFLIDKGANVNWKDHSHHEQRTPLALAIQYNNVELARYLLKNGADPNQTTEDENTPLLFATTWNSYEMVPILLEAGANVNQGDYDGFTPLMIACVDGHLETIQILLKAGADVQAKAFLNYERTQTRDVFDCARISRCPEDVLSLLKILK